MRETSVALVILTLAVKSQSECLPGVYDVEYSDCAYSDLPDDSDYWVRTIIIDIFEFHRVETNLE